MVNRGCPPTTASFLFARCRVWGHGYFPLIGLIPRANRVRDGIGDMARIVRLHTSLDLAKMGSEGTVAKDLLNPAREIVPPEVSCQTIGRQCREESREFLQRAGAGAGA